jgi:Putative metal-binding motif
MTIVNGRRKKMKKRTNKTIRLMLCIGICGIFLAMAFPTAIAEPNLGWNFWSKAPNMYNTNPGNIGIGTTTPTAKLDIYGNIAIKGHVIIDASGHWVGPTITGLQGPPGPQGIQGLKGDKGDTGAQGLKGDTGAAGSQGLPPAHEWLLTQLRFMKPDGTWGAYVDLKGEKGDKGDTGEQGLQGEQGQPGPKGDKGDSGTVGNYLTLPPIPTPNTPTEGFIIYCDLADGKLKALDKSGVITILATSQTDADGDGYYAEINDCNDNNGAIHPGATEVCDGVDNDCDGLIDEGLTATFYQDTDGDGYGNPSVSIQACSAPAGYVSNHNDCSDNDASINPGATEVCDGKDNDCDGMVDEMGAQGCTIYYFDVDSDGYGQSNNYECLCGPDARGYFATQGGDCNDNNGAIHPGATEVCDGVDNDCDGLIDEGCP